MKSIVKLCVGLVMALAWSSACAQFSFKIPGLGGSTGNNSNTPDIGTIFGHASKMVKGIDEPEEIQIGQNFAATLLGAKPIMADEHIQHYVNALGHWLALQTERPDLPWTFAVLEDPGFNAFATPGGYIFVTRGLVQRMHNESELAGVLAHEIGHVLRKHHLKAVQKNAGAELLGDLASTRGANSEIKSTVVNFAKNLYAKGLDKDDEFEADRLGVVIAARAGYDPFGLPAVLQMLQEQSASDNNFSLLMKTHPPPADRLDRLDALMADKFDTVAGISGGIVADRIKGF
ncbi:MAG: M48 family metalloprotease [Burkholderiaceae bacterium]|nr:M48 family metalloprotease [Burkholderiaceae bacterium]